MDPSPTRSPIRKYTPPQKTSLKKYTVPKKNLPKKSTKATKNSTFVSKQTNGRKKGGKKESESSDNDSPVRGITPPGIIYNWSK